MIFFQEYELITFARKKGSKDKQPRKKRGWFNREVSTPKPTPANEVKPFIRDGLTPVERKVKKVIRDAKEAQTLRESTNRMIDNTLERAEKARQEMKIRNRRVLAAVALTGLGGAGLAGYSLYKSRKNNKRGNK